MAASRCVLHRSLSIASRGLPSLHPINRSLLDARPPRNTDGRFHRHVPSSSLAPPRVPSRRRVSFFSTDTPPPAARADSDDDGGTTGRSVGASNAAAAPGVALPLRFEDLPRLHPRILKALRRQGIHRLTEIQERTFEPIVGGDNVVGKSRTGTGKTLAFLVPALERLMQSQEQEEREEDRWAPGDEADGPEHRPGREPPGIQILILAPTRELAAQIGKEADKLLLATAAQAHRDDDDAPRPHPPLSCQVVYGGSSKEEDVRRFNARLPTILVATPGRLKDHLATTVLRGDRPFAGSLHGLRTLVLDEMDRLLQLGFRRDIQDILSSVPRAGRQDRDDPLRRRQTLLFSATLPPAVLDVVDQAMSGSGGSSRGGDGRKDYHYVDCIQGEDPTAQTNDATKQSYVVLPNHKFWTGTMELLMDLIEQSEREKSNAKIMVFFPMTRLVQLYSALFTLRLGRQRVWELHGKMHQRERTVVARRFRNAPKGLLLTSDVSARGLDYPNVTHVVQVGAAQSRETYIHRLGRTGRAGRVGSGLLVLPELERGFLEELEGLDIGHDRPLEKRLSRPRLRRDLQDELGLLGQDIRTGGDGGIAECLHLAYQSMISYYFQTSDTQQSEQVVSTINQLVQDFGLHELPAIDYQRAKNIGIDVIPGLNIQKSWKDQNWDGGWGDDIRPGDTNFQRKPYGNFDEWFGPPKSQSRTTPPPNGRHGPASMPRQDRRGETRTRFAPRDSEQRPPKPKAKKRGSLHFNQVQRWEVPGEFRKQDK